MRKTIYLLKSVVVVALLLLATTVGASTTYFVSASGNDGNNGLSEAQAFKTFAKALEVAEDYDNIQVVGNISMPDNVTVDKQVRFLGDGKSEITSAGPTGCFTVVLESIESYVLFQDLIFAGCTNEADGGVCVVNSGRAHFTGCIFEENHSETMGGVIMAHGEDTFLSLYNCEFYDNTSTGAGAALRLYENATLDAAFCIFDGNIGYDKGGCLRLQSITANFYSCIFHNNQSGHRADGNDMGGGVGWLTGAGGRYIFQACDITNNMCYGDHGSAFIVEDDNVSDFINCTFGNNINGGVNAGEGRTAELGYKEGGTGCIWYLGGVLTFVNVTMARNYTACGNNGGNGSGVTIQNAGITFNAYNSIIVGNIARGGDCGANGSCDVVVRAAMNGFTIKNSVIGNIHNGQGDPWTADDPTAPWTIQDGNGGKSLVQEYGYNTGFDWDIEDQSGLFTDYGYMNSKRGMNCFPFTDSRAYAATLGDPALLAEYDLDVDQYLAQRTGDKIWAGAQQGIVDMGKDPVDPEIPSDPMISLFEGAHTGITQASVDARISAGIISDGLLMVNFGALSGKAKGELFNANGQLVQVVFDGAVSGVGYYSVDALAAGFYTLKVSMDGKAYASKLIVK